MMNTEKEQFIENFTPTSSNHGLMNEFFWSIGDKIVTKNNASSEKTRKEGNKLFSKHQHDEKTHRQIFEYYCIAISEAISGSETLALAYNNRSVFLSHIGKYDHCIKDVEKALSITKCNVLKVKLFARKVECLKKLGLTEFVQPLKDARSCLNRIDDGDAKKANLQKVLAKADEASLQTLKEELKKKHDNSTKIIAEILAAKDIDKVHDSVSIKYDDSKYGRHLVANKDFKPGDIIFVEKLYANVLYYNMKTTNCQNCTKVCWSGVPCDHCTRFMFCDEKCKKEAWEKFHDLECSVLSDKVTLTFQSNCHLFISLRLLILAIKESGSVSHLKAELESIDNEPVTPYKGFIKNGKFYSNTIRSIYTLSHNDILQNDVELLSLEAGVMLMCLIRHTSLFGEKYNINMPDDLLKNEDAIFIGSLYYKLCKVKLRNTIHFQCCVLLACQYLYNNNYEVDDEKILPQDCSARGICIAPFQSLINHSCYPNVGSVFTEDQKVIIYAIHPITKGTQIFQCYYADFYSYSEKLRKEYLTEYYNFNCYCRACKENWPLIQNIDQQRDKIHYQNEIKVYCQKIGEELKKSEPCVCLNSIRILKKAMLKAFKHFSEPSAIVAGITQYLKLVYAHIYGLKLMTFGACSKQ